MVRVWGFMKPYVDCFDPSRGHYQVEEDYVEVYCEEFITPPDAPIKGSKITEDQIKVYGNRQEEIAKFIADSLNGREEEFDG